MEVSPAEQAVIPQAPLVRRCCGPGAQQATSPTTSLRRRWRNSHRLIALSGARRLTSRRQSHTSRVPGRRQGGEAAVDVGLSR